MSLSGSTRRGKPATRLSRWAVCFVSFAVLAACGGLPTALPGDGVLSRQPTSTIGPSDSVRISFPRVIDGDSVRGQVRITQNDRPVDFGYSLEEDGHSLVLFPRTQWRRGEPVRIRLGSGQEGLCFSDGEMLPEIELIYLVEDTA